jgi:hypothetical protein
MKKFLLLLCVVLCFGFTQKPTDKKVYVTMYTELVEKMWLGTVGDAKDANWILVHHLVAQRTTYRPNNVQGTLVLVLDSGDAALWESLLANPDLKVSSQRRTLLDANLGESVIHALGLQLYLNQLNPCTFEMNLPAGYDSGRIGWNCPYSAAARKRILEMCKDGIQPNN